MTAYGQDLMAADKSLDRYRVLGFDRHAYPGGGHRFLIRDGIEPHPAETEDVGLGQTTQPHI